MPRREDGTLLPAVLVALLLAMMLLQLALTGASDLPSGSAGRLPSVAGEVRVASIAAGPPILDRPLFSPTRRGGDSAGGSGLADSPLGDAVLAGMVSGRGFGRAVLRLSGGAVHQVPLGGSFRGWRLDALTAEGARFGKDGQHININYGSGTVQAPEPAPEEE